MATPGEAHSSPSSPSLGARERTAWFCRRFGLRVPMRQAPIAGTCPASLASADGMSACEKINGAAFVGSIGIFQPLDWLEPEIAYSLDRPFWRQDFATEARRPATGCSGIFRCLGPRASCAPTITHRNSSRSGFAKGHWNCVVPPLTTGCTTGPNAEEK